MNIDIIIATLGFLAIFIGLCFLISMFIKFMKEVKKRDGYYLFKIGRFSI